MKRLKQNGFDIVVAMFLPSCGGCAIKEKIVKASGVSISDDGSSYINVVEGDYILKVVSDKGVAESL